LVRFDLSLKNVRPQQKDNAFVCSNLIEETGKAGSAAFYSPLYRTAK
jgi:hypothetical protein